MFFLIRCVFWLWVVFSTIFAQNSTHDTLARQPAPHASASVQSITPVAEGWLRGAAAQVADRCVAAPATCLAVASQLSRLAAGREESAAPPTVTPRSAPVEASRRVDVPLPPRRPNFAAHFAGLGESPPPKVEKTARRAYLMNQSRAEADF
jgi:hypothetical protein